MHLHKTDPACRIRLGPPPGQRATSGPRRCRALAIPYPAAGSVLVVQDLRQMLSLRVQDQVLGMSNEDGILWPRAVRPGRRAASDASAQVRKPDLSAKRDDRRAARQPGIGTGRVAGRVDADRDRVRRAALRRGCRRGDGRAAAAVALRRARPATGRGRRGRRAGPVAAGRYSIRVLTGVPSSRERRALDAAVPDMGLCP